MTPAIRPRLLSRFEVGGGLLVAVVLLAVPLVAAPFQTITVCYGLVFAIAALGFNLLLGPLGR